MKSKSIPLELINIYPVNEANVLIYFSNISHFNFNKRRHGTMNNIKKYYIVTDFLLKKLIP